MSCKRLQQQFAWAAQAFGNPISAAIHAKPGILTAHHKVAKRKQGSKWHKNRKAGVMPARKGMCSLSYGADVYPHLFPTSSTHEQVVFLQIQQQKQLNQTHAIIYMVSGNNQEEKFKPAVRLQHQLFDKDAFVKGKPKMPSFWTKGQRDKEGFPSKMTSPSQKPEKVVSEIYFRTCPWTFNLFSTWESCTTQC